MKTKISLLGLIVLSACVSCNQDSSVMEEISQPQEPVYDGSIAYITAGVYDNQTDTVANPPQPQVVPVCNLNILADEVTEVESTEKSIWYAMDANIPEGKSLKIVLKSQKIGIWGHVYQPAPENWTIGEYKFRDGKPGDVEQTFTVKEAGKPSHLWISFFPSDEIQINFYENESAQPNKTKLLKVKYTGKDPLMNPVDSTFIYPEVEE